jgi:HAD superfamily phosphatase
MGDAPDKPDPTGLLRLAAELLAWRGLAMGAGAPPVAYLGDTVADVETVQRARHQHPDQRFWSLAVAPPHLHKPEQREIRASYEARLQAAGADRILAHTADVAGAVLELVGAS